MNGPEYAGQARATAQIDVAALRHNLSVVRKLVPKAAVMAVIKADGYGHGMELVAGALSSVDEFAVSSFTDVARLRAMGVSHKITTLSAQFDQLEVTQLDAQTVLTVFDKSQVSALASSSLTRPLDVWLKVDTGMGRLGFLPNEVEAALDALRQQQSVRKVGVMTHLANADQPGAPRNLDQIHALEMLVKNLDFDAVSLLNSAGICSFADAAYDVVRPGLMLYGISPVVGTTATALNLKPVMTLTAKLLSVRDLPAGSQIGYGGLVTLERASRIAIVACGYGDGYPRHAVSGTRVVINGEMCSLIGRVSMDMIAVDLGETKAEVGDTAVLWGQGNPIEEVAAKADTIAYELTCGVTARVQRETING